MTDLSESTTVGYQPTGLDEFVDAEGRVRPHWRHVAEVVDRLGPGELRQRARDLERLLASEGVSYTGPEQRGEAEWPADLLPLLVSSDDWATVEAGVTQRAVLLDLVVRDLYGPRDLLRRRLLPPEVVFGHPGFLRSADGAPRTGPHLLSLYGVDVGRGPDGSFSVITDRAEVPAGFGYAMANRTALSRVLPSLYRDSHVHRVAPFFRALRTHLQQVGATISDDPRIVVLTPGAQSATNYEQAAVASSLGFNLVEASDLVVRDGRVQLRALGRLEPVDVILRRVEGPLCDPLELRPDSASGVPGLIEVWRRGRVAIVNTPGSGVLESPGMHRFLPQIAQALLGEDLILAEAPSFWCGDATERAHVLANLETFVCRSTHQRDGVTAYFGSTMSDAERRDLHDRIETDPVSWVGQETVVLSTAPTLVGREVVPRPSLLRTFAVSRGESFSVMAGGLARVASEIPPGTDAVSKDTWVLASEPERLSELWLRPGPVVRAIDPGLSMSARAAENLFWAGRYLERAESVARLLRVIEDRRSDFDHTGPDRSAPGVAAVDALLRALTRITGTLPGFVGDDADALLAAPAAELFALTCDRRRVGSLAHAVGKLIGAAESVRDQLSVDTWVVIGSLESQLRTLSNARIDRRDVVQGTLSQVMQSLLAVHGLIGESMVRDPGWYFLDAGRRIERAVQTGRLLRNLVVDEHDDATSSLVFESVLTASESIITYRRRYRSRAQVETMLDLLVMDPGNPRAMRYQVDRLGDALSALPGAGSDRLTEPERQVLDVSTTLRMAVTSTLAEIEGDTRPALDAFLQRVVAQLQTTSDAVARTNFVDQRGPRSFTATGRNRPADGGWQN